MSHQFTEEEFDILYKLVIKAYHEWKRIENIGGPMMEASAARETAKYLALARKVMDVRCQPEEPGAPMTKERLLGEMEQLMVKTRNSSNWSDSLFLGLAVAELNTCWTNLHEFDKKISAYQNLCADVNRPPVCKDCNDTGYNGTSFDGFTVSKTCCHCPAGREIENRLRAIKEQS